MIPPDRHLVLCAACATLFFSAACTDDPGPHLDTVTPSTAAAGAIVTITGAHLCGSSGDCATAGGALRIGYDNPVQAIIITYEDTSAEVRVPPITPVGKTVFIATVNERASNALDFEVLAAP